MENSVNACKHGLLLGTCAFCRTLESEPKGTLMDEVITKKCSKCGEEKNLEYFSKAKAGLYGRKTKCKSCEKKDNHDWWLRKKASKAVTKKSKEKIASGGAVVKKLIEKTTPLRVPESPVEPPDLAKIKADEHWSYIKMLLSVHLEDPGDISCIEFHYKTAFIHGYKHGQLDAPRSEQVLKDNELR